jgi:hypothetical protein
LVLAKLQAGLVLNVGLESLKEGITRIVNGLSEQRRGPGQFGQRISRRVAESAECAKWALCGEGTRGHGDSTENSEEPQFLFWLHSESIFMRFGFQNEHYGILRSAAQKRCLIFKNFCQS